MDNFWRSAGVFLGKRWVVVFVGVALITVVLGVGLSGLEFATGQDSYLNSDSQVLADNVEYQDLFGGEIAVVLFKAEDGSDITDLFTPENGAELYRAEQELRAVDESFAVILPLTAMHYSHNLLANNVATEALNDAVKRDEDPASVELRNADVQLSLARLGQAGDEPTVEFGTEGTFDNQEWIDLLLFDNRGFTLDEDGNPVPPADADRGIRESLAGTFPDQETAVGGIIIKGNATLDELSAGTESVLEIMDTVELDGFEIITTGSPVFLKEINDYLQGGMLTLGAIAIVVMAIVLFFAFRVRWRFVSLAVVVIGVIWAFAILGFIGIDLSLVTISGLPILIGMGVDFSIQIQNRVEEEVVQDKESHPMAETLASLGPALVTATIGAVFAFIALQVSRVPMIRDFGVMLAIGIVMLCLVGIVVTTSLLGIREWRKPTTERADAPVIEKSVIWLGSLPLAAAPIMVGLAVVIFVAGILLEDQFKIESDPVKWIDQDSAAATDLDILQEEAGFTSTLGIYIQSNNVLDQTLSDVVHEFTYASEEREDVSTTSSIVNTFTKIINIPGANRVPPSSATLSDGVDQMPTDVRLALANDDLTATQVNLRLDEPSLEERSKIVDELEADLEGRLAAADLPEDSILLVELPAGQEAIRAIPSGLAVVGVGLLENLKQNRAQLTYIGLALVALWFLIRFRSVVKAMLALVPVVLAVGTSSLIVAVLGITLSPLTTVSGPLVIATCGEFSVLMLLRYLEERRRGLSARDATDFASARTGRAFVASALTTVGGFAVLMTSPMPLLRDFGIIVTLNVVVALLSALVVVPTLLVWSDNRGWIDPEETMPGGGAMAAWIGAMVIAVAALVGLWASSQVDEEKATSVAYAAQPLPTTTSTTIAAIEEIDVSSFGTEPPVGVVGSTIFTLVTANGGEAQNAVCAYEVLISRLPEDEVLAGVAAGDQAVLDLVIQAGLDCEIPQEVLDAALANL